MVDVFTFNTVFRAVVGSFLLAEAVIWGVEMRKTGFKRWLSYEAQKKSYLQYLLSLRPEQGLRLLVLWMLFLGLIVILLLAL